jgi:hypothetical protein
MNEEYACAVCNCYYMQGNFRGAGTVVGYAAAAHQVAKGRPTKSTSRTSASRVHRAISATIHEINKSDINYSFPKNSPVDSPTPPRIRARIRTSVVRRVNMSTYDDRSSLTAL